MLVPGVPGTLAPGDAGATSTGVMPHPLGRSQGHAAPPAPLPRAMGTRWAALLLPLATLLMLYTGLGLHFLPAPPHHRSNTLAAACPRRLQRAGLLLTGDGSGDGNAQRRRAYARMAADLPAHGLHLGANITQGLTQAQLFRLRPPSEGDRSDRAPDNSAIEPILTPLAVPVRALVLPLTDTAVAAQLHAVVRARLGAALNPSGIWWQDPALYHTSLFHASSHMAPVPASAAEVAVEVAAARRVASATCPLRAVLERVVATRSGVVVACWQVVPGVGEPAALRQALAHALPRAPPPVHQAVREPALLHSTVARLLAPARWPGSAAEAPSGAAARRVVRALAAASDELCGLSTVFGELWYAQEGDLLALALGGRFEKHALPLACPA